jgi:methyl-accepting chemotaxis protein
MRVRILAVVVLVLVISSLGSVLLLRAALLDQLDEEVSESLAREAQEFRLLADGNDPRTGRPFDGDLAAIFEVYFSREVPDEGETLLAFLDGHLVASRRASDAAAPDQLGAATTYWPSLTEEERGERETAAGPAEYVALPLTGSDGEQGLFVVANFPAFEREEIAESLRTQQLISLLALLLATTLGAVLAGRVLRPLVVLAATAREISDTDLSRRIPIRGGDEASQIAEAFNDMLGRLEEAFTSQRRFLDDTSHELRCVRR